jgi:hypothetical protein
LVTSRLAPAAPKRQYVHDLHERRGMPLYEAFKLTRNRKYLEDALFESFGLVPSGLSVQSVDRRLSWSEIPPIVFPFVNISAKAD